MKNSTHRDGTEFKSTGRRNLDNGLPAKTKAIKLGDLRQIGGIGPERSPGNDWPKGYSQTFKARRRGKCDAPEVLGAEDLEYKTPDPEE